MLLDRAGEGWGRRHSGIVGSEVSRRIFLPKFSGLREEVSVMLREDWAVACRRAWVLACCRHCCMKSRARAARGWLAMAAALEEILSKVRRYLTRPLSTYTPIGDARGWSAMYWHKGEARRMGLSMCRAGYQCCAGVSPDLLCLHQVMHQTRLDFRVRLNESVGRSARTRNCLAECADFIAVCELPRRCLSSSKISEHTPITKTL